MPNTCSSPNGPFRFNVNVQSCLSTIDTDQHKEAFTTLNMNGGVAFEPVGIKLFNTNPFAIAFKRSRPEGFVTLGATNRLLRVTLNDAGQPIDQSADRPRATPVGIVRIELKAPDEIGVADPDDAIGGKNPRGIVLNSTDTRAYVMDFISRDIVVVDISGDNPAQYAAIARMPSGQSAGGRHRSRRSPSAASRCSTRAIGPEGDDADTSKRPAGLMSDTGWGTCYSCHPIALTDTVTWMFPDGPRQAISMESTFEPAPRRSSTARRALPESHQRALNWSAVRDELAGLRPQYPRGLRRRRA